MHAAQRSAWHEVRAAIRRSVTMSASASRPPGAKHARRLGEHPALVGREIDHAVGDHGVERAVLEGQLLDPRAMEAHVLVAAQALGLGELLGRDIHADDRAARPDLRRGREHVHAGAAAEIKHPLAREQARETEVVAHARERVHGLGGQPAEQLGGVAERLGERTAGGEVQVAARLVRHVAVHLRDVAVELLGIHAPGGWYVVFGVHAGSVAGASEGDQPSACGECLGWLMATILLRRGARVASRPVPVFCPRAPVRALPAAPPRADVELAIDVAQVPLDGLDGHELALGDLPVGQARRRQRRDAVLAGRQRLPPRQQPPVARAGARPRRPAPRARDPPVRSLPGAPSRQAPRAGHRAHRPGCVSCAHAMVVAWSAAVVIYARVCDERGRTSSPAGRGHTDCPTIRRPSSLASRRTCPALLSGGRAERGQLPAAHPSALVGAIPLLGRENREAGVRLVAAATDASVEVKCLDASANPLPARRRRACARPRRD